MTQELAPGSRIGSLEIERELGRGAFGAVWLARDTLLGRRVALKVIPGGAGQVPAEVREQILHEARIVASLHSPHIVKLFRLHEADDGGFYLEMELVTGGALEDRLEEGRALPIADAIRVFRGILRALLVSHGARVLHGDIKPANVLFGADGTPKLADFGVARLLEGAGAEIELHGQVFGSPLYMAPEVLTGRSAGPGADLWSAAVVFYRLLAGHLPFTAETLPQLFPKLLHGDPPPLPESVPEGVADLVLRCLAKDAATRPSPIADVLAELDGLTPGEDDADVATNLTADPSLFVGRERETEELAALLAAPEVRLVTVAGPPGVGKSRLAREACSRILARFPGGVWWVELLAARDAEDVRRLVSAALQGGELRHRRPTLLVLDGFEHLLACSPETVSVWRSQAPDSRILVTSRALLRLAGERILELGPLSPDDSRRLLRELSGPELADAELASLEGMPLGIEYAAEAGVAAGREALVDAAARSFELLPPPERSALLQLAAVPGEITLEAAEELLDLSGFEEMPFAMDVVQSLRDQGLLAGRDETFRLPGFVRELARREGG